ncbi:hypothetical protein KAR91_63245 [Candidatus Pacearchaeota archaeon]|nr:hypothetical protein [Candidatus Pacearchaeota archaeon]
MKITVCSSMSFAKEMIEIKSQLECVGHEIILPRNTESYADESLSEESRRESAKNKINEDLIRAYFKKIEESDAVLIVNLPKNDIDHYVGGNTFLEIAFAHVLNKKVFLLNPIPEVSYSDELVAMQPIILNGDLSLIN